METREETLGKLYALRAGLSYIAQEVAPIYQEEGDLRPYELMDHADEQKLNSMTESQRKKYDEIQKIKEKAEERSTFEEEISFFEDDLEDDKKTAKKSKFVHSVFILPLRILGMILVAVGILSAALAAFTFIDGWIMELIPEEYFWTCIGIGLGGLVVFGGIGWLLLAFTIESKYEKAKSSVKGTNNIIEGLKEDIETSKTAEKELARLRQEGKQKKREVAEHKREVAKRTRPIYYALKESTESFISERDWENLDLVIYYFDTGRADTIKEALQLVDRQKQTDMIVNAIRQASSEITTMIVTATRAVISAVDVACEQICSRLDSIDSNIGKLNASIDANTAATASLVSATQLQNALMAQANRTSAQLASDVSYLKGEYALMRRM